MKNQRVIYEALLAGEVLTSEGVDVFFKNGELRTSEGGRCTYTFVYPEDWQIYKEPKWYENIPEGSFIPCKVWDNKKDVRYAFVAGITDYKDFFYKTSAGGAWKNAERLTKQEIQIYLDNAPEKL